MSGKLDGRTVLVPESRELDLFANMLEAQGAHAVRCPLIAIHEPEDPQPVRLWLERLCHGGFDDLVILTGEGLRRLLSAADRLGWRLDAVAAIGRLRTAVRGPKPVRALKEIGLAPGLVAAAPTSAGLVETLSLHDLTARRVGLQLYPDADPMLVQFLTARGAAVHPVTPYRYASEAEAATVADAIRAMAEGRIDVVAFTSSPQVRRLLAVAREKGLEGVLSEAWTRTRVASVGPVVTAGLEAAGIAVAAQPRANFHLKPLAAAIAELLAGEPSARPPRMD